MPEDTAAVTAPQAGPVSQWLTGQGFDHQLLEPDHLGVEVIGVEAPFLPVIAAALKPRASITCRFRAATTRAPAASL